MHRREANSATVLNPVLNKISFMMQASLEDAVERLEVLEAEQAVLRARRVGSLSLFEGLLCLCLCRMHL